MAIEWVTLARSGLKAPKINPMPKAHIALLIQPACSSAILVDGGLVTLLEQTDPRGAEGYAKGYASAAGLDYVMVSADRGDAASQYAHHMDEHGDNCPYCLVLRKHSAPRGWESVQGGSGLSDRSRSEEDAPVICPQCEGEPAQCNGYCEDTGLVTASHAAEWLRQNI